MRSVSGVRVTAQLGHRDTGYSRFNISCVMCLDEEEFEMFGHSGLRCSFMSLEKRNAEYFEIRC